MNLSPEGSEQYNEMVSYSEQLEETLAVKTIVDELEN